MLTNCWSGLQVLSESFTNSTDNLDTSDTFESTLTEIPWEEAPTPKMLLLSPELLPTTQLDSSADSPDSLSSLFEDEDLDTEMEDIPVPAFDEPQVPMS